MKREREREEEKAELSALNFAFLPVPLPHLETGRSKQKRTVRRDRYISV